VKGGGGGRQPLVSAGCSSSEARIGDGGINLCIGQHLELDGVAVARDRHELNLVAAQRGAVHALAQHLGGKCYGCVVVMLGVGGCNVRGGWL